MVTNDILYRTFFIKAEDYGTAFTIDVDGIEYLVTAKHLLDTDKKSFNLKIFCKKEWHEVPVEVVGHGRGEIDISVLRLPRRFTNEALVVHPTVGGLALGQDIFFAGFPYKMWADVGDFLNGWPCALVKKGTASSIGFGDPQTLFVDAINNVGFSGGPLFFQPLSGPRKIHIAGVVSKFRIEYEPVLDELYEETNFKVAINTGFLVAYGSKHILEIIHRAVSS